MGGQDKGLLLWQGQPMARHVYQVLRQITPSVYISANRSLNFYEQLAPGHVLPDPENIRYEGPLAGLLTGLKVAAEKGHQAVLICPCDTPEITPAILRQLITTWQKQPDRPAIAQSQNRTHPLHGVYPVALMDNLQAWLNNGNRKVMTFTNASKAVLVNCPEAQQALKNRNTPSDLK